MVWVALTAVLVVSYLAGLLSFRVKQRWCPTCGATLTCPDPTYHANPADDRRLR